MTTTGVLQLADIFRQNPVLATLTAILIILIIAWEFRSVIKAHSDLFGFGLIILAAIFLAALSNPGDWLLMPIVFMASSILPTTVILARRVHTPWWIYVSVVNSALAFWFAISILNTDTALWINLLITTILFIVSLAVTWTLKDTVDTWTEISRRLQERD